MLFSCNGSFCGCTPKTISLVDLNVVMNWMPCFKTRGDLGIKNTVSVNIPHTLASHGSFKKHTTHKTFVK